MDTSRASGGSPKRVTRLRVKRAVGQSIRIGEATVTLLKASGYRGRKTIHLAIEAPLSVDID